MFPGEFGIARSWYFPLDPTYWGICKMDPLSRVIRGTTNRKLPFLVCFLTGYICLKTWSKLQFFKLLKYARPCCFCSVFYNPLLLVGRVRSVIKCIELFCRIKRRRVSLQGLYAAWRAVRHEALAAPPDYSLDIFQTFCCIFSIYAAHFSLLGIIYISDCNDS